LNYSLYHLFRLYSLFINRCLSLSLSLLSCEQERGLRSGTLAPPLCVGMGAAAEVCMQDMEHDTQWITYLSNKLKK
jgi:cysteine sulfinate desulfinase/cysteine desulfurase-like protein